MRLFLCGDVMLGRGIDQIMPQSCDPGLHEHYVKSALTYIELAQRVNGPIPRPADYDYIWGDALGELERASPTARIINLETSITISDDFAPKGIHYRMHPRNISALAAAKIDCCVLANNHVLDWGRAGLEETLQTLDSAGILRPGAGRSADEAAAPAGMIAAGCRLLVFAFGFESSGIPPDWAAGVARPGINFLAEASEQAIASIARQTKAAARTGDILIASVHWGSNWRYTVPVAERAFAHDLVDIAGFHVVHGHSSHHPKAIERYHDRLVLYGCGDFITDYEGIAGHEQFRGDLAVMYLAEMKVDGALSALRMIPFQLRRFRLNRASPDDARWLQGRLERESAIFGTHVALNPDNSLSLVW